jgi:hypothetical protein
MSTVRQVRQPTARPVGQQGPPARAAASAVGALRVARGSLLLTTGTASHRARCDHDRGHRLDPNRKPKHHPPDPQGTLPPGRLQIGMVAGFVSEWGAGFKLECMAGFVGILNFANYGARF